MNITFTYIVCKGGQPFSFFLSVSMDYTQTGAKNQQTELENELMQYKMNGREKVVGQVRARTFRPGLENARTQLGALIPMSGCVKNALGDRNPTKTATQIPTPHRIQLICSTILCLYFNSGRDKLSNDVPFEYDNILLN